MKKNNVFDYYNKYGWKEQKNGLLLDASVNMNTKKFSQKYNSNVHRRILNQLLDQPECSFGKLLDCASGALHIKEYIEYSAKFDRRYCVDFSSDALSIASKNLEEAGQKKCEFFCTDFFNKDFGMDFFDSSISIATLYHIEKQRQEEFVLKILNSTKPGMKVIISYSNPYSLETFIRSPISLVLFVRDSIKKLFLKRQVEEALYFERHPIFWWKRFSKKGSVEILTHRFFSAFTENLFVPNNKFGEYIYSVLFWIETFSFSKYLATHYFVVLKKDR